MNARDRSGMTFLVKTITRLTLGFILLYGIYIALNGHVSPGGGFAGGVIIALSFIHIMLAFGKEVALLRLRSYILRIAVCIGALSFLTAVMASFYAARYSGGIAQGKGPFFEIFNNELILPFCEMFIVGCGLFGIFVALTLLSKSDKNAE